MWLHRFFFAGVADQLGSGSPQEDCCISKGEMGED
jgi:hypothetical protein